MMLREIKWTGGTIGRAGVYSNIPLARYHASDVCDGLSISSSGLRTIWHESPRHYWYRSPLNPNRAPEETSRQMVLGAAAHHLFLGQAAFNEHFIKTPDECEDARGIA